MIIVLCGVSGSGKTTIGKLLAEKLGWTFFDADDYHPPSNIEKMRAGIPLDDDDRVPWLSALAGIIANEQDAGRPAVLACSALKRAHRERLGIDQEKVVTVFLDGKPDLIASRMSARDHEFMPASLLKSQFNTLERPEHGLTVGIAAEPPTICCKIVEHFQLDR